MIVKLLVHHWSVNRNNCWKLMGSNVFERLLDLSFSLPFSFILKLSREKQVSLFLCMKMLCVNAISHCLWNKNLQMKEMSDHLPLLSPPATEYSAVVIYCKRLPRKTILSCIFFVGMQGSFFLENGRMLLYVCGVGSEEMKTVSWSTGLNRKQPNVCLFSCYQVVHWMGTCLDGKKDFLNHEQGRKVPKSLSRTAASMG